MAEQSSGSPTVVQPLGLALQGHARGVGLHAAPAAAHALRAVQRHHDVAQLPCAEGAAVHQLVVVHDAPPDT